jgi:hypothetical protein
VDGGDGLPDVVYQLQRLGEDHAVEDGIGNLWRIGQIGNDRGDGLAGSKSL